MQVLADAQLGEDARAAAQLHDPLAEAHLGVDVRERAAVETDDAAVGDAQPADRPEQRRLPRAVGAEQREHLAACHLEPDVEQHLHRSVAEVEVVDLQHRDVVRVRAHALELRLLLDQLLDRERDVALQVPRRRT